MLDAALKQNGSGQGIDIAGATIGSMLIISAVTLVQGRATKVHRSHRVADKGMRATILSLSVAGTLSETQIL